MLVRNVRPKPYTTDLAVQVDFSSAGRGRNTKPAVRSAQKVGWEECAGGEEKTTRYSWGPAVRLINQHPRPEQVGEMAAGTDRKSVLRTGKSAKFHMKMACGAVWRRQEQGVCGVELGA